MKIMEELFSAGHWRIIGTDIHLPDGTIVHETLAFRPLSVHILAFSQRNEVILLREYRPALKRHMWMLPSGKIEPQKGEVDLLETAQRELREESGYEAKQLRQYCTCRHMADLETFNFIFIGTDLRQNPLPQDVDERIEVHFMPLDQAIETVLHEPFAHTTTAYALLRYAREYGS